MRSYLTKKKSIGVRSRKQMYDRRIRCADHMTRFSLITWHYLRQHMVAAQCYQSETVSGKSHMPPNAGKITLFKKLEQKKPVGHIRDPSGGSIPVRNLRITMQDVNSRPPQPTLARKFLNESVSLSCNERNTTLQIGYGQACDLVAATRTLRPGRRECFLLLQATLATWSPRFMTRCYHGTKA
ncbi:unnamed protein product [Timema podura]|uniref:Ribosomal protein S11 n=1 Tax=Timema podura TaxID=61482 RepID=A0ABN7NF22_TIMPD|nr:unnamed protein product [Timema podura]